MSYLSLDGNLMKVGEIHLQFNHPYKCCLSCESSAQTAFAKEFDRDCEKNGFIRRGRAVYGPVRLGQPSEPAQSPRPSAEASKHLQQKFQNFLLEWEEVCGETALDTLMACAEFVA